MLSKLRKIIDFALSHYFDLLCRRLVLVCVTPKDFVGKKEPQDFWLEVASVVSANSIGKLLLQAGKLCNVFGKRTWPIVFAGLALANDDRFAIFRIYVDLLFAIRPVGCFVDNCEGVTFVQIVVAHTIEEFPYVIFKLSIYRFGTT